MMILLECIGIITQLFNQHMVNADIFREVNGG